MATGSGVPVKLNRVLYDKLKDHAIMNGKAVSTVVNDAMETWLETEGAAVTEHRLERMALAATVN